MRRIAAGLRTLRRTTGHSHTLWACTAITRSPEWLDAILPPPSMISPSNLHVRGSRLLAFDRGESLDASA